MESTPRGSKSPQLRIILYSVLVGLLVMWVLTLLGPDPSSRHPWVGQKVPNVEVDSLINADAPYPTGESTDKVTLINFWGPWCPACLMELPDLVKIRKQMVANPDFEFVSIASDGGWVPGRSPDYQEDRAYLLAEVPLILGELEPGLPTYIDSDARLRRQLHEMGEWSGYPTTILVGKDREIQRVWIGYEPDHRVILDAVNQALHSEPTSKVAVAEGAN